MQGFLCTLMTPVARAQMSVEGCALERRRSSTPTSAAASASLAARAARSTAHRQAACKSGALSTIIRAVPFLTSPINQPESDTLQSNDTIL